ncbi:MAG TPA: hypothetical protein VFI22_03395 [Thermomicrobiales bacterium]|nr:hypothetical protein [Thermomicrobiales bacterium]
MPRPLALFAALLLLLAGSTAALAQDATPVGALASLGYPELKVTITDQAYELSTQQIPAGLVLMTVVNASNDATGAAILGPPEGSTMQDLMTMAATPAADDQFPPFLFQARILGGPGDVAPGGSAQAVVNVPAGDWAVFGEGSQPPTMLTATGGTPTAQSEPASTVTVTEMEMSFLGLDGPIPAGPQVWKVVNNGKQPHMLVLGKVPDGTTLAQVLASMSLPENATPAPGMLQESDFQPAGGVLLQSSGTTVWPALDLAPGRYVALCFVTDPATGQPHVALGMISLFDVGGAAATPSA